MSRIAVIGTGYVGLTTGAGFADHGNDVVCADIDEDKIARLLKGEIPIFEPGLDTLVERNIKAGRLKFTTDNGEAARHGEVTFMAVGTPSTSDGSANLSYLFAAAQDIGKHLERFTVIVNKSTVPVGIAERIQRIVGEQTDQEFVVASNPEFLKEGNAIDDFMKPDRIVIGSDEDDQFSRDIMSRLYHPVSLSSSRIIFMDPASAELTKYVANTMLAMRISFMNEISTLCEAVNADIHSVRRGVGSDARIGPKFLYAGPGYGGSCFPKDVTALAHTAGEHGIELELTSATARVNMRQKSVLARKLKHAHFDGDLRGRRIAVWGVAFKPRTDDIREAPALQLIDTLLSEGATVAVHDPEAMAHAKARYGDRIEACDNPYDAAKGADALVLVTEWRLYQSPDFQRLKGLLKRPLLIDGRNIWSTYKLAEQGFTYDGIGVRA